MSSKEGKRIRLQTSSDVEAGVERIAQEFGISSLIYDRRGKAKRKDSETRNRLYDIKAVTKGQASQLLRVAQQLPDVSSFHDVEGDNDEVSTQIVKLFVMT